MFCNLLLSCVSFLLEDKLRWTQNKRQKFVPPSHKHLTTQNQNFNVIILWWCRSISMWIFRLQLISDLLILNAKVMSTVDAEHIWKGRGLQQQQPANFLNQVGVSILCPKFITSWRNLAESFCFPKNLFENQCARKLFQILAQFFFKNGPFLSHCRRLGLNIWYGLVL